MFIGNPQAGFPHNHEPNGKSFPYSMRKWMKSFRKMAKSSKVLFQMHSVKLCDTRLYPTKEMLSRKSRSVWNETASKRRSWWNIPSFLMKEHASLMSLTWWLLECRRVYQERRRRHQRGWSKDSSPSQIWTWLHKTFTACIDCLRHSEEIRYRPPAEQALRLVGMLWNIKSCLKRFQLII